MEKLYSALCHFFLLHFTNQITLKQSLAHTSSLIFKFSSIKRQIYIPVWTHKGIKDEEKMETLLSSVIQDKS